MSNASVQIPSSNKCCHVAIIDTTCDITAFPDYLTEPPIPGYDWMSMPTYSFYIKHERTGRQLLFDLGARKDWENHVPHILALLKGFVPGFRVRSDVLDIIAEGGVDVNKLEALVLSHHHFDHCGAPSKLPPQMKVVVGPGFREDFLPGYPAQEHSTFHEADFPPERELVELDFKDELRIGQFKAHDYFGDGSLYLLHMPGHTRNHIAGLVRTTPDTFVLLGGDVCHHTGDIRPSQYIELPETIPDVAVLDHRISRPCPCSAFLSSHPKGSEGKSVPFLQPSSGPRSFYADHAESLKSLRGLIELDASPNILTAIAHDPTSLAVFDFFPKSMNDWKKEGWKEASHWGFLSELPYDGKCVREPRVDGLYGSDGRKVRGLALP